MSKVSEVAGPTASKNIQEALNKIEPILKEHDLVGLVFLTDQSSDREIPFVDGEQRTACLRHTGVSWNPIYEGYGKKKSAKEVAFDSLNLILGLTNLQTALSTMAGSLDEFKQVLRRRCIESPEVGEEMTKLLELCRARSEGIKEARGKTQEKE